MFYIDCAIDVDLPHDSGLMDNSFREFEDGLVEFCNRNIRSSGT